MKKNISKISRYFKIEKLKNDTRVVVFLVCLLIATILWFLNALSKDYLTTISYPVKYVSPPENQFLANEPPSKLDLKVNAHGFTLLRHKLSLSFSPIVLNLSIITQDIDNSADGFKINSSNLIRRISNQISSEITINDIQPEILRIKLDSLKTKRIQVEENIEMNFKPQFNIKESVIINPEVVDITGPAATLDTIYILYTEEKSFDKIESDIETTLKIIHPKNTTVKPEEITLKIPVEKFTEKEIKVPIKILNKPKNAIIKLFPSEVKLTILVGLGEFEEIGSSNFNVFVDIENADNNSEDLPVTVESDDSGIQIIRFDPERVEYLIETN